MKRMTYFVMALALVLGFTQCKKEQPQPQSEGVRISLNVTNGNSNGTRANVTPPSVSFVSGDQILVASNGHYVGTLMASQSGENVTFSGDITNPTEGQPLYFYFLGNKQGELVNGAGNCTVNISDQTGYPALPVISMGVSIDRSTGEPVYYSSETTAYEAQLHNKCSLMKFNVTTPSEAAICITGMNNVVNVNFGQPTEANYGFTYGMDAEDGGLIKMHAKNADNETWAIVLPQAELAAGEEGSAYSDEGIYVGSRPAIHAIEVNKFYHEGDDVANVTLTNYTIKATPLTIEAKEAGATVRLSLPSQAGATMEYSTDGTNWSSYPSNTDITLTNAGDKVMFRAPVSGNTRLGYLQNSGYGVYVVNGSRFYISNKDCYVYGNVMSLLYQDFFDKTSFPEEYTMPSLFSGCGKLYNHPGKAIILPATTLAVSCYESMFNNCTNLTTIPELPATTLVKSCYKSMFNNCKSLTSIPSDLLPSTDLAESCYQSMFNGCSGLTSIPGDLLPATTLKNNCYQNMFTSCTGLTSIPENLLQSVTTLANYCYASMFSSCSGLTSVPNDLLPVTTLAPYCYQYMFTKCSGLTTAPDLPAAELVSYCYYYMFENCSNLHSIKCLATSGINENQSTSSWVYNVSATGTFTKASGVTWPTGTSGIPSGWTVISQ